MIKMDDRKIRLALIILDLLKLKIEHHNSANDSAGSIFISVEGYNNGREQGFVLAGDETSVAFAENRNTDDIVVYCGKGMMAKSDERITDGKLSEFAYRHAAYIEPDRIDMVVNFIFQYMTTGDFDSAVKRLINARVTNRP